MASCVNYSSSTTHQVWELLNKYSSSLWITYHQTLIKPVNYSSSTSHEVCELLVLSSSSSRWIPHHQLLLPSSTAPQVFLAFFSSSVPSSIIFSISLTINDTVRSLGSITPRWIHFGMVVRACLKPSLLRMYSAPTGSICLPPHESSLWLKETETKLIVHKPECKIALMFLMTSLRPDSVI